MRRRWRMLNRHCEVTELNSQCSSAATPVFGSVLPGATLEALILYRIASKVFDEYARNAAIRDVANRRPAPMQATRPPVQDGAMRDAAGFTQPLLDDRSFRSTTFGYLPV